MTEKLNFERKGDLLTVSKLIRPIIIDILFDKNQVFISQVYQIPKWYGTHQYQARKKNERTRVNNTEHPKRKIFEYNKIHVGTCRERASVRERQIECIRIHMQCG